MISVSSERAHASSYLVINSNLGPIAQFPRHGQFSVEKRTFFLPLARLAFNLKFENDPVEPHPQILYTESLDKGLIISAKSFPL